ncbi:MAG: prepilin peptidase [Actinobacteria bacterium]|jgi:prepilin peptidase CpaA|nr:MAG: prepilin peptidase [Actinomycetota bacterium]
MWTAKLIFLWLFTAAAGYSDLRYRKVPNRLIMAAMAGGLTLAAAGGWGSLRMGLSGMALGFLLLFPAFLLRMVGGGDVKSLAVIGLAAGPGLLWISFMFGTAAGGLAAVFLLVLRRLRSHGERAGEPAWTLPYAGILSLAASLSALFL